MSRITRKQLEARAAWINKLTGSPLESSTRIDGRYVANVGNFHISGAYGGYCLHRMVNESGGVTTPLISYHVPARELWEQMGAFIAGLEFKK